MHNWLSNFVGNNRFSGFVVGHLSYEEAGKFYESITSKGFYGWKVLPFGEMHIGSICGESMFLLQELYELYLSTGIHPSNFFYVYQAQLKLIKAMEPQNQFYQDPLGSRPVWQNEELIEVIEALVCSEGGYIYYDESIKSIG